MSVRKATVDEKIDLVQNPKRKLAGAETGRNPALLSSLIVTMAGESLEENQTVCLTITINLRHHVDHLVAEAFLGCYLDRVVLSQLQRLQPRRHSLKVSVLRF
jgi:hypothetical protein